MDRAARHTPGPATADRAAATDPVGTAGARAAVLALALAALLPACASTARFDPAEAAAALVSERGSAAAPAGTPWSFLGGSLVWVTDRRVDRSATEESLKLVLMQEMRERGFPPAAPGEARARLGFVLVFERELDAGTVSRVLGGSPKAVPAAGHRAHPPGTLVLQVVDAATGDLVWRGDVDAGVALEQDAALRNERVRRAVRLLLDAFAGAD